MQYQVDDLRIFSENAAKPACDAARILVQWLSEREETPSALDYGCGKLRYTSHLAARSRKIGICDSTVQLTRLQTIHGERTSVAEFARSRWPHCTIHELEAFLRTQEKKYHFVLCANVLSAIPSVIVRSQSLNAIRNSLATNGRALFVNQHTNSYFTTARRKPTTRPHLDGWITGTGRRCSYYGVLNKDSVVQLTSAHGLRTVKAWFAGQSNYVLTESAS